MDQDKTTLFKQAAIDSGYTPEEVDLFVEQAQSISPQPSDKTFTFGDQPMPVMGVEDEVNQMSRLMTPQEQFEVFGSQDTMLPSRFPVTQPFGNFNPSLERYSGGRNLGTDFSVPQNTPLSVPPGEWEVVKASPGWNGGSGNYIQVKNVTTGETIGFEHLSKIGVQPGQRVSGGTVIGLSGGGQSGPGRGNSTNSHASIPYQDAQGRYKDILQSPYGKYLYGS